MGPHIDGDEFEKSFNESVSIFSTIAKLRYIIVTLYQQGGRPETMIDKHKFYIMSDIVIVDVAEREYEMMRLIIETCDRHVSRFLKLFST